MKIPSQPTRLILVEGVPGSGKTTTAQFVQDWLRRNGFQARLYLEGDLDHPADYESVACLSDIEYTNLLEKYPIQRGILDQHATLRGGDFFLPYRKLDNRFGNRLPEGLVAELARYEVYELPLDKHCRVTAEYWQAFTNRALQEKIVYIFECCFLQNPLTTLFARHNLDAEAAAAHIQRLVEITSPLSPQMIYLDPADIRRTLEKAAQHRPKEWLDYVIGYITGQAWGAAHQQSGFDGMVNFYQMRRDVEKELFDRLPWQKLWLDQAGRDWARTTRQVEAFLTKAENL